MSDEGAELLDQVADFLAEYVAFPSLEARDAVALWAVHTHAINCFESTPRLALLSAEKQSGKTRTLEVLELLLPNAKHASNLTPAALFRLVGADDGCQLLFDEVDVFFGHKAKEHEELRGLLNAGHRRGAVAYRCVGEPSRMKVQEFPAFCAVALAGIGELPDTILDRAILVAMRRRSAEESVKPFRLREALPRGEELRDWCSDWTSTRTEAINNNRPEMPEGITDRPADVWEPLLALADVAGGEWPRRARVAAVALNRERQAADPSMGLRLLSDIHEILRGRAAESIATADLVGALVAIEEAPWGDLRGKPLDARRLARRLQPFQVKPKVLRIGLNVVRGYEATDFQDAFRRYLSDPEASVTTVTTATRPAANGHAPTLFETVAEDEQALQAFTDADFPADLVDAEVAAL